jgi:hypothetical protein
MQKDSHGNITNVKDATHVVVVEGDLTSVSLSDIVLAKVIFSSESNAVAKSAEADPENFTREIDCDWDRAEYEPTIRSSTSYLVGEGVKWTNIDFFYCGTALVLMAKAYDSTEDHLANWPY